MEETCAYIFTKYDFNDIISTIFTSVWHIKTGSFVNARK